MNADSKNFLKQLVETPSPSGYEQEVQKLESLAARFAAKEAVAKALGSPGGMAWHDCEVVVEGHGQPNLEIRGTVAARAELLGVRAWHLSLSHDGGIASAVVIAES